MVGREFRVRRRLLGSSFAHLTLNRDMCKTHPKEDAVLAKEGRPRMLAAMPSSPLPGAENAIASLSDMEDKFGDGVTPPRAAMCQPQIGPGLGGGTLRSHQ